MLFTSVTNIFGINQIKDLVTIRGKKLYKPTIIDIYSHQYSIYKPRIINYNITVG